MYDLSKHPMFTRWNDPESGVESFLLTERVAPVQFPFYFVTPSISANGEYLWFQAAFPPNPEKVLGVAGLNPARPFIRLFPQAHAGAPMVTPDSLGAYFTSESAVFFIDVEGKTRKLGELPADFINCRHLYSLATHLTVSADGKYLVLDSNVGNTYVLWLLEIATGTAKILHEFEYKHNHAQFSPVDPDLILLPRDWHRDQVTGRYLYMETRLWLTNVKQTIYHNLNPDFWEGHDGNTAHEWWTRDGMVDYINYELGVFEFNPYTRETTHVWKHPLCHAHCDSQRRYYCADHLTYNWAEMPVQILFFDRETGKETKIASAMPRPPYPRSPYHLDPHPQFSPDDEYVIYLSSVLGNVDTALTPTRPLKA